MKHVLTFSVMVILIGSSVSLGDDTKKSQASKAAEPTTEQRQKMAELHERMASCLRSERSVGECRQDMMKGCRDTLGKEGCPMTGGKMQHGKHPYDG
jgi:hypothetical protein